MLVKSSKICHSRGGAVQQELCFLAVSETAVIQGSWFPAEQRWVEWIWRGQQTMKNKIFIQDWNSAALKQKQRQMVDFTLHLNLRGTYVGKSSRTSVGDGGVQTTSGQA